MHTIGTLALRRSDSPSPPPAFPSPITVPKRVLPKLSATTTFAYEPRPSTTPSFGFDGASFGPPVSSIGTRTLKRQPSWASASSITSPTSAALRSTVFDIPESPSKRSVDSERVRPPGSYDKRCGFSFEGAHTSPKGFYVRSIEEFLGDSTPARRRH